MIIPNSSIIIITQIKHGGFWQLPHRERVNLGLLPMQSSEFTKSLWFGSNLKL